MPLNKKTTKFGNNEIILEYMSSRKSIGNTFTVTTMDDPISVEAQYAPNDSPTTDQIHTTWQDGDLYMRTRESNEATWSNWHRIVGESGGETDFSFGISEYKTTSSATTAPSDINTWSDAPLAVTSAKPYLWAKVQQKSWNESTQSYNIDSTRYIRLTGEAGVSITSANVWYAVTNSETTTPDNESFTYDNFPTTLNAGYYVWEATKVTYSNGNSEFTGKMCLGATTDFLSGTEVYAISTSSSTPPADNDATHTYWNTTYSKTKGYYLWTATRVQYTNGNYAYLNKKCVGYWGEDGNGISSVTRTYARSQNSTSTNDTTSPSNIDTTIGTNGWATTSPAVNEMYPYLWVKEVVTYTQAATTTKFYCIGARGANGVDAQDIEWVYVRTKTNVAPIIKHNNSNDDDNNYNYVDDNGATWNDDDFLPVASVTSGEIEENLLGLDDSSWDGDNSSHHYGECTDDPKGVTSVWQYEWELKREKGVADANGHRSWNAYRGTMTLHNSFAISISSANIVYFLSTANTGQPTPNTTYDTLAQVFAASSSVSTQYVWQVADVVKSDAATHIYSGWCCLGLVKDIKSGTEVYAVHTSGTVVPADSSFSTSYTMQAGKYLWGATKVVSGTNSSDYAIVGKICLGYWGEDGTSPISADLSNEMDSVSCDKNGVTTSAQTVTSYASIWKGSTQQPITGLSCKVNGSTLGTSYNTNGYRFSYNTSTGYCEIGVNTGVTISTKVIATITVSATIDGTSVSRELQLTINGARQGVDGTPATIFSLVPSASSIKRNKSNVLSPTSPMTCNVLKKVGNASSVQATSSDGTLRYRVDGDITSSTDGTELAINTGTVAFTSTNSYIVFAFFVGTTMVDKERVPIIYDGADGENAAILQISPTSILYQATSGGAASSAQSFSITFYLVVDGDNCEVNSGNVSVSLISGVTYSSLSTSSLSLNIASGASPSGTVTITVTGTYSGKAYSASAGVYVAAAKQGQSITGQRGKTGRFYYYAGVWNDFSSSDSWTVSDAQAPYFFYNSNYWVFNPDTNDTYTKSSIISTYGNPSNNSPWVLMNNEFKYLITEAIFGSYAHFGAAIINGDYLMSQYGYVLGFGNTKTTISDDTQYQHVDTSDILGENDMYDSNALIWNDSEERTISSTTYTTIKNANFTAGRYYTLEIDENTELDGNELSWALTSYSGTIRASGTITSTSSGTNKNCTNFKCTVSETCYLKMKITTSGNTVDINGIYLRLAKFVPYLAIDMLAGKLVTNNIIARGELHADSLYYTMVYGNSNNDYITVEEQSIVNLGTVAVGTTIKLQSPSKSKGRIIEVFNNAASFKMTWVGATSTSAFSAAYGSGWGLQTSYNITYKYLKIYCDGTTWWVLRAEN